MFDLIFFFIDGSYMSFDGIRFLEAESIGDVRSWLNGSRRLIDLKDTIINMDNVKLVSVVPSKERGQDEN